MARVGSYRTRILLFAAGVNLILLQLFMVREFAITLFCTELIILLVTTSYFAGYSIGYVLSPRIDPRWIRPWLFAVVVSHLPMIAGVRVISGWLGSQGFTEIAIPLVLLVSAVTLSSFYTIFLPRVVSAEGNSARSLASCYSLELAGSAAGLIAALILARWSVGAVAVLYLAVLVAVAWCLGYSRRYIGVTVAAALLVIKFMPAFDRASTEYFYAHFFGIDEPRLLYSRHSPYQKIDVLDTANGRALYLNGLEYFNTDDLEEFNFFLSEVPARLAGRDEPADILIVGSGSMSSLTHVGPYAASITTVEIDALVIEAGLRYFSQYNRVSGVEDRWNLVIDDAKHYLSTTDETFDLIIIDVPAPWYVQTGLLFTQEFYRLAGSRLNDGGILSVYLTETITMREPKRISAQILAALVQEFGDLYVVNSGAAPYGFAMAGDNLGFTRQDVVTTIRDAEHRSPFQTFQRSQIVNLIGDTRPSSYDNLDIVWDLNVWALPY